MEAMSLCCSSFPFYLLLGILLTFVTSTSSNGNETDQFALLAFKARITNDPLGVMDSWNNSIHFCKWNGVTCDHRRLRVRVLDLSSHKLSGSISPHLGNLTFLQNLTLQNNSFSKQIPPELGRLRSLQHLLLDNNVLTGQIPTNLTSCLNLVNISLSYNQLSGEIPTEIHSLRNLRVLYLRNNNLFGGIPSSLGNLSSLSELRIGTNNLRGRIPQSLGRLKSLTWFAIGFNSFHGTIPPSLYNVSSMVNFAIYGNQLHGTLPLGLGIHIFPNLQFLGISGNRFVGSIPPSISNISSLRIVLLDYNNLTGHVPNLENLRKLEWLVVNYNHLGSGHGQDLRFLSTLTNATHLEVLYATFNNFGGLLPESISNFSSRKLKNFRLDGNQIVGSIPSGIGNLKSLEFLSASRNQLTSSIPDDIGELQRLQRLYLDHNQLAGSIPYSLGNLHKLNELDLSGNKFEGSIPSSLGKCQSLLTLTLSDNNISGAIPLEVFNISSLSVLLDLSKNHLVGVIPNEIGNLKNLCELDVSQNMLWGKIPTTLGSCQSLERLRMSGNFFRGTIPSTFANLRGVQYLNLSHNNLSGEIPMFFQNPGLECLDLSFNNFSGMVPSGGIFKNATAVSIKGNDMLCGTTSMLSLPICKQKIRTPLKLNILIAIGSSSLAGFVIVTCLVFLWLKKRGGNKGNASSSLEISTLQMSYQTLFKATNGFSSSNLIGAGSFGFVYKGFLDPARSIVVKVFKLEQRGAYRSFMVECEALRNMRHRNLVKVITACSSIDIHGNEFKALVYEFMVNGSLEKWLHPALVSKGTHEATKNLCLLQRLSISIDIAWALNYLHCEYGQTPVIHCDLKPSNVLLDDEMTAKVGDFGLVKFLSRRTTNLSTNQPSTSIGVRGTVGYAAPEYGMGSEVSTYGDMYSYGILLLEMFSGKMPTDDMFDDQMNLHNYVKTWYPEQVEEITDPALLQEIVGSSERYQKVIKETLVLIFGVGIACSKEMPRERMDISVVVAKLKVIRDNLITARAN